MNEGDTKLSELNVLTGLSGSGVTSCKNFILLNFLSILTSTSTQTHFYEQLLDTYTHKSSIETVETKFSAQMS